MHRPHKKSDVKLSLADRAPNDGEARFEKSAHVAKAPIALVTIEAVRIDGNHGAVFQPGAVHDVEIQITVLVIVEEGGAGSKRAHDVTLLRLACGVPVLGGRLAL